MIDTTPEGVAARRAHIGRLTETGLYAREIAEVLRIHLRTVQRHQRALRLGVPIGKRGPRR